jgi:hypothetical protein
MKISDDKIVKLNEYLAEKLHKHLVKWCLDKHVQNYMSGGIYQFYPSYVQFSKYHMYVNGTEGATLIIPMPDNSAYWEEAKKLHDEINKGACV